MAQRSVYQSCAHPAARVSLAAKETADLPEAFRAEAEEVLAAEKQILAQEQRILDNSSGAA